MRSITNEARIVMNTRRNFVNYARMTLHDGTVLNLTPSDFRISGNSFTDDWSDSEAFQLGSAIGKTATLLLDNTDGRTEVVGTSTVTYPHGKFSQYDFYMAYFELYVHLPDATHYQGQLIDEVFSIGTFTVTTPVARGATIEITGVDNMYMFDKSFNECTLDFNNNGQGQTLITILNRCCSDCGVAIGYTSFTNQNLKVYKKPQDVTYREVVSYIAQIAGCNAVISVSGALQLKWYDMTPVLEVLDGGHFEPWDGTSDSTDGGSFNPWTTGDIVDGGDFSTPIRYHNLKSVSGTSVSTDDIYFTGVMVSYEVESNGSTETESVHYPDVVDWDYYVLQIESNPFVTQSNASTIATSVWDKISGLTFRVFNTSSLQDPTIEAGDCALVYDVKGNIYPTIITNVVFTTGGMTEVSCVAESPTKQNQRYVNPAAKATAKAIAEMDAYNVMVAHFNEIANAALGYYKTEVQEQGTTVTYYHSAATLPASKNIVKINANGIFISDDYGVSYNSGVDITTATMLMNLVYVRGLNADWITAGKVDTSYLNVDGIITAYNNTGTVTISGGKITAKSISGGKIADKGVTATQIADSTITGAKIASTTIDGGNIKTDTITASNIAASAITASELASNAVTTAKLNASAVTAAKIASNAITADKISSGAITTGKIAANAITTAKLAAGAVTANELAANSVTASKISVSNLAAINATMGALKVNTTLTIEANGKIGQSAGNLSGMTMGNGAFAVSAPRDNSWTGLFFGTEVTTKTGWSTANCVLWNGGDSGGCFAVISGSPNEGDTGNFSALKQSSLQFWQYYSLIAEYDVGGYHYYSDERLKEDIKSIELTKVEKFFKAINPVSFVPIIGDDKRIRYGVIAQEIEQVFKECELDKGIIVEEETTTKEKYKTITYTEFIGLELAGIKHLYEKIDEQQEEIDQLKSEVAELKKLVNSLIKER